MLLALALCVPPTAGTAGQRTRRGPALRAQQGQELQGRRRSRPPSGDRNARNTTRVIVTLAPGAKLPAEFKKFMSRVRDGKNANVLSSLLGGPDDNKLDLINGQVLELPNSVLRMLAAHPSVFKLQYDRPIKTHNYRTSVSHRRARSSRTFSATPAPASASPSSTRGSRPGTTT